MKLIWLPFIILMLAAACNRPDPGGTPGTRARSNDGYLHAQQTPNTDPRQTAAHLESLARGIPQVEDATCVVFGRTAIVGINVSPNLERSQVDTVKYAVAEALKKDPNGANALVTADLDLGQRIREMNARMAEGRPLGGFAEELGDIIGRVMPQYPRDVPEQTPLPAATEAPRGQTR